MCGVHVACTLSNFLAMAAFNFGKPWPHYDEEGKWCNCVTYQ